MTWGEGIHLKKIGNQKAEKKTVFYLKIKNDNNCKVKDTINKVKINDRMEKKYRWATSD